MKPKYDVIFVVLVYKNVDDIQSFLKQKILSEISCRTIIVESFSDARCTQRIKNIADLNNCDFIPVENKGYGFGNNTGIEYALKHYDFKHLVVCNADVDILQFPESLPIEFKGKVVAPVMSTINGKPQNPFWAKENRVAEFFMYKGFKLKIPFVSYIGFALYKIQRIIFLSKFNRNPASERAIMAAHGAFVIYSRDVFDIVGLPYDENMFLFAEECLLAHKLKKHGIMTVMTKRIQIRHHEDGSMNKSNIKQLEERRKSITYYYENWYRK